MDAEYCERCGVEQTNTKLWPQSRGLWTTGDMSSASVNFSANVSKTLVMDGLRCSTHFYPKTFEVCWVESQNLVL
jgi:hypothetical protein